MKLYKSLAFCAIIVSLMIYCKSKREKWLTLQHDLELSIYAWDLNSFTKLGNKYKSEASKYDEIDKPTQAALDINGDLLRKILAAERADFLRAYLEATGISINKIYEQARSEKQIALITSLGGNFEKAMSEGVNILIVAASMEDKILLEKHFKENPKLYTRYEGSGNSAATESVEYRAAAAPATIAFKFFYAKKMISRVTILAAARANNYCQSAVEYARYLGLEVKDDKGWFLISNCVAGDERYFADFSPTAQLKLANQLEKDGANMLLAYWREIVLRDKDAESRFIALNGSEVNLPFLEKLTTKTNNILIRDNKGLNILSYVYACPDFHSDVAPPQKGSSYEYTEDQSKEICKAQQYLQRVGKEFLKKVYAKALDDAKSGDLKIIDELKAQKIKLDDVTAETGQTLLMEAVIYNQTALVEKLLEERVNVAAKRNDGKKALDLAAAGVNAEILALLAKYGG